MESGIISLLKPQRKNERTEMNHKQKQSNRREMLGCAKIAQGARKYNAHEEAIKWEKQAAKHLFRLNGLMGNW
jgi:hypothetical protein